MNENQLFNSAGEALFGENWQQEFARQFCVSDRSVRRWVSGSDQIPPGVWWDVHERLRTDAIISDPDLLEWIYKLALKNDASLPPPPKKNEWAVEIHDPLSGRHSRVGTIVVKTLGDVQAEIQKHPGMTYRIRVPSEASAADWEAFHRLNPVRV